MVVHEIAPIFDKNSKVLILGTMPSPKSRQAAFYYMHPQNRFWRVLGAILEEDFSVSTEQKRNILLKRRIALWDVLKSCDIDGASDASIKNEVPNDLNIIFSSSKIDQVFTTGRTAEKFYQKYFGKECIALYSPSAANCAISFERLCEDYSQILEFLK